MPLTIVTANNPLALTSGTRIGPFVSGPPLTSGMGYSFDTFPNPQYGFAAGVQYLLNKFSGRTVGDTLASAFNGDQAAVQAQGISLSDIVGPNNAAKIAAGIATNEGAAGAFGGISNLLKGVPLVGGPLSDITNAGANAFNASSSATQSATQGLAGLIVAIQNFFSINTAQRATAVVLGVILALIAVAILIAENKTVQETTRRVGTVATLAAK